MYILCGVLVVIPLKYRKFILEELHSGHPGIIRMKSLGRLHVWWPGIDKEIESVVQNCEACQSVRNKQPPSIFTPGPGPRFHGKESNWILLVLLWAVCS